MGCFCHHTAATLALQMPSLNVSASVSLGAGLGAPASLAAELASALAAWLAAHGLPADPWQPDPSWLDQPLPMPRLSAQAVATVSAMVQLRAQVLAQFGLDLLVPQQATAFARIVATMNARLPSLPPVDPSGWVQLASLNSAIDQVQAALRAGLLTPSPGQLQALTMPGGLPMRQWASLLNALRLLAPLIAASLQLNAGVTETAQLAAALRVLARLPLPALAAPSLVAGLAAALSAVAQLQASLGPSLGAPVLQLGLPAVRVQVQAKLSAMLQAVASAFGLSPSALMAMAAESAVAMLLSMLPKLPAAPGSLATPDVVQMAMQAQALASISWQVPVSVPAVQTGLATATLIAQVQAVLGLSLVLPAPCGSGCDARALMQALSAA